MNLTSRANIRRLMKNHGLKPAKYLGQNFLIDKGALKKIIQAADLNSQDTVLEIGPGIGTLTQELAKNVKKVIAVEKDRNMVKILKETLKGFNNVEIIQNDILRSDLSKLRTLGGRTSLNYKVVGNLPFYLTAPVIRKFLEMSEVRPQSMVLVVQKEVGQRICARPPKMNLLAVSVQVYAAPKVISYVSKKSFWPQPKVDAAIIKFVPHQFCVPISRQFRERFFRIVKAGFSQPRKQLVNNLSKGLNLDREKVKCWLERNTIQSTQRAETLRLEDWLSLVKNL